MTKASDNVFPKVLFSLNTSDPAAPSDSSWKMYPKAGGIYARSSNAIVGPFGSGGSATVATVDATLGADVTMTSANTLYDGPSASFAAGTWLVIYKMLFKTAGTNTHDFVAKLWDGSTIYDESENDTASVAANFGFQLTGMAIVTLGSTTTLKVSVMDNRASTVLQRDNFSGQSGFGTSHTATRLVGYKVT
jgi:hypothetical protein